jgi:hypothetical protein
LSARAFAKSAALLALAVGARSAWAVAATDLASLMRECSAITTRDERLACFDHVAETLQAAPKDTTRVAPAVAAAATSTDPRARFGFSATQIEQAREAQAPSKQGLAVLTARVAGARRMANGGWLITLDNSQVWRQVSPSEYLEPTVGGQVTIKPASFGSFLMVDGSRHSARVHREQ